MCITTLNPKAPEWKPTPKHLHPPPFPHRLSNSLPLYDPFYTVASWPLCYVYSPPVYETAVDKPGDKPTVENPPGFAATTEGRKLNRQKCPQAVNPRRIRLSLPPRLQRAEPPSSAEKKPPPGVREWRHKKSAHLPAAPVDPHGCVSGSDKNTTVMIKNIPNRLRRDFMLKFLDGYSRTNELEYDFFYLPMDFRKKYNLGYAFVNFTTSVAALKFKELLQNFMWRRLVGSNKVCDITWARIQGQKALINRFKNSMFACRRLDFLPVIMDPPRNGSDRNPSPPVVLGSLNFSAWKKLG